MFTIIYRWRVKPELESEFVEGWAEITRFYLENADGALGSRLHRAEDGILYAYAQWRSEEHRRKAFENAPIFPASAKMKAAVEESFPEIRLEIVSDFLRPPEKY
jgi:heme-degrading monooxygenase HmoA